MSFSSQFVMKGFLLAIEAHSIKRGKIVELICSSKTYRYTSEQFPCLVGRGDNVITSALCSTSLFVMLKLRQANEATKQ